MTIPILYILLFYNLLMLIISNQKYKNKTKKIIEKESSQLPESKQRLTMYIKLECPDSYANNTTLEKSKTT